MARRRSGDGEVVSLTDTGSPINLIAQELAVKWGMKDPRPTKAWMSIEGRPLTIYGEHTMSIETRDGQGEWRQQTINVVAADITGYQLLLGIPWHKEARPITDWEAEPLRFSFPTEKNTQLPSKWEVISADKMSRQLKRAAKERIVAYVCYAQPHQTDPSRLVVGGIHPLDIKAYKQYADVFDDSKAQTLPERTEFDHEIDTENASPPYGPLYNLSGPELAALREYLDEHLKKGWISPSKSPAGAPIIFVPKKDGSLRLCVDYRGLNKVTRKNRYPLPLISEIINRVAGAAIFTKLDLRDAFNRIRIKEGHEWKTAFRTRYGLYEYNVMPFGLTNAPATFQAYVNHALEGLVDLCCVVFVDDILIYSAREEDHERDVCRVLERLQQYSLYAKLSKCEFHTKSVEFLGYVLSTNGVSMEKSRIEAIQGWPTPKNHKDVQVFLGTTNFYRRFIHHYSSIAKGLTDLLLGSQDRKRFPQ
jgi:Reverse transcriptase (RNA-dependent DNA polymerase)